MLLVLAGVASTASNCKPGTISVTAPVASVIEGGSKTSVSWTTQNMVSDVKVDLTLDNGVSFTNLIPAVAFNAGPQQVKLPNPQTTADGTAFIRLTNLDNTSMHADSAKFSIVAMSEQYLSFADVHAIRPAAFQDNKQAAPTDCRDLGQVDGTRDDVKYAALPRGVLYRIRCTGATGGTANPESFKNFVLSNGWVVSEVQTFQGDKGGSGNITCTLPAIGTDRPATTCHLSSNVGGFDEFVVAILIKGRKGTTPF